MSFANHAKMVSQMVDTATRLDAVAHDPAVVKAYKQFCTDGRQLVRSTGTLAFESKAAWRRSAT